ncbi:DUF3275 family protein [Sodalis sp. RH22]
MVRTIHGRNGPFIVGKLITPVGKFEVKDAELEQYPEDKHEGDFVIGYMSPHVFTAGRWVGFEICVYLVGMTLPVLDALSRDEVENFTSQEVDPLDEEQGTSWITHAASLQSEPAPLLGTMDPLIDTTPVGVGAPSSAVATSGSPGSDDATLSGTLWPLGESVKLGSTIDRRTLRAQIARLDALGYALDFKTQAWSREAERQPA